MKRARRGPGLRDGQHERCRSSSPEPLNEVPGSPRSMEDSDNDGDKKELRRIKNREAARRVRERRASQINTFKQQVDQLRRENQRLLSCLKQAQEQRVASGDPAVAAAIAAAAAGEIQPAELASLLHQAPPGLPAPDAAAAQTPVAAPVAPPATLLPAAAAAAGPAACTDEEESEAAVIVTLSSSSSLPLVTTQGPRRPMLTVDDLQISLPDSLVLHSDGRTPDNRRPGTDSAATPTTRLTWPPRTQPARTMPPPHHQLLVAAAGARTCEAEPQDPTLDTMSPASSATSPEPVRGQLPRGCFPRVPGAAAPCGGSGGSGAAASGVGTTNGGSAASEEAARSWQRPPSPQNAGLQSWASLTGPPASASIPLPQQPSPQQQQQPSMAPRQPLHQPPPLLHPQPLPALATYGSHTPAPTPAHPVMPPATFSLALSWPLHLGRPSLPPPPLQPAATGAAAAAAAFSSLMWDAEPDAAATLADRSGPGASAAAAYSRFRPAQLMPSGPTPLGSDHLHGAPEPPPLAPSCSAGGSPQPLPCCPLSGAGAPLLGEWDLWSALMAGGAPGPAGGGAGVSAPLMCDPGMCAPCHVAVDGGCAVERQLARLRGAPTLHGGGAAALQGGAPLHGAAGDGAGLGAALEDDMAWL